MEIYKQEEQGNPNYKAEMQELSEKKKKLLMEGAILQAEKVERSLQALRERKTNR